MSLPTPHFPRINQLLTQTRLQLLFWDDPYAKGVWSALLKNTKDMIDLVAKTDAETLSELADVDEWVNIDWLPVALGSDIMDSMSKLEIKLSQLPDEAFEKDSIWLSSVGVYLFNSETEMLN